MRGLLRMTCFRSHRVFKVHPECSCIISTLFPFRAHSPLWDRPYLFICSSADGQWWWFQLSTVKNEAAVNVCRGGFAWMFVFTSPWCVPRGRIAVYIVALCLAFGGTTM